jgi:hypothetical protein
VKTWLAIRRKTLRVDRSSSRINAVKRMRTPCAAYALARMTSIAHPTRPCREMQTDSPRQSPQPPAPRSRAPPRSESSIILVPGLTGNSVETEAPSLHRRYPASPVLRAPPSPCTARPVPRGRPVGRSSRPRHRASRVASVFLRRHGIANISADRQGASVARFPYHDSLLRTQDRIGVRIERFGTCSGFTHVMACQLAKSPMATLYIEGFSRFVTSTTAPITTGWSDSCRAGLTPR